MLPLVSVPIISLVGIHLPIFLANRKLHTVVESLLSAVVLVYALLHYGIINSFIW